MSGIKALLLDAGGRNRAPRLSEIMLPEKDLKGLIHPECEAVEHVLIETSEGVIDAWCDDYGMSRRPLVPSLLVDRPDRPMPIWGNVVFARFMRWPEVAEPHFDSLPPSVIMRIASYVKRSQAALASWIRKGGGPDLKVRAARLKQ